MASVIRGCIAIKQEEYERIYINASWFAIISSAIYFILYSMMMRNIIFSNIIFIVSCAGLNIYKSYLAKADKISDKTLPVLRALECLILAATILFCGGNQAVLILFAVTLTITSLSMGMIAGGTLVGIWGSLLYVVSIINTVLAENNIVKTYGISTFNEDKTLIYYFIAYIALVYLCGRTYTNRIESENKNKILVEELEEKCKYLVTENDHEDLQIKQLKQANLELESTNKKLLGNLAEFFTLQQISQAIGSIFDVNELLKYVNDIILGVMGVNYSTIILYDPVTDRLRVHNTNIKNESDLLAMTDNINCQSLFEVVNNSKPIVENIVDADKYIFTLGRGINSLICVPLTTKTQCFGIVLVEHTYNNAFNDNNVRLLEIIGQQVGIAMENAELYQKMRDMANTDGLTGVYNRQFFQARLDIEIENAKNNNYDLSLAIFDIDFFKKFNDTFGHLFGDKVLKVISRTVGGALGNDDILARFGGEEFIILFPRLNISEAYEKVEKLRTLIENTKVRDELVAASVTVSFGVASFPNCALSGVQLLKSADDALYIAKESGRNCVRTANVLQTI